MSHIDLTTTVVLPTEAHAEIVTVYVDSDAEVSFTTWAVHFSWVTGARRMKCTRCRTGLARPMILQGREVVAPQILAVPDGGWVHDECATGAWEVTQSC